MKVMILMASQPLTHSDGLDTLNPFTQHVLDLMNKSPYVYQYDTPKQLSFELKLRESLVQSSIDLLHSGAAYAVFEQSYCNPAYWTLTPQGGFLLNPRTPSSKAIRDIYMNGTQYAFECATAMIIVLYKAVLDVLGDKTFDILFQDLLLWAWEYDQDLGLRTERRNDYLPGDIVYFKNPDVNPATPEFQGENAVVMGNGTYYGHGMGITTADEIISTLNSKRRFLSFRSAFLMDQVTRPDYLYLSQFVAGPMRVGIGKIGNTMYRWAISS